MPAQPDSIPPVWLRATETTAPIPSLSSLPTYGALFFLRNIGGFRIPFLLITAASVAGALLGFGFIFMMSELINQAKSVTASEILNWYLPLFLGIIIAKEIFEYFIRKYGEAFSTVYSDHLQLRFLLSVLKLRFTALSNMQPQRLVALVYRYIRNVTFFVDDWFWGLSRRLTQLVLTLGILYVQSPLVLAANVVYFAVFLGIALRLSAKLSPLAERYSAEDLAASTVIGSFSANLPTVRRLGIEPFFASTYREAIHAKWARFSAVREFHARRWFLQLVLYESGYVGTLGFGVYQVASGTLSLGYLVLIKYAFDTLSAILIHVIEYYVALVQQREDSKVIRREFAELESEAARSSDPIRLGEWQTLELRDAHCTFTPSAQDGPPISISVPRLTFTKGSAIGIIGPSGTGKSSLLSMLLNIIEFDGEYLLDGRSIRGRSFSPEDVTVINNTDPLFALTLRENLLLGKRISDEAIREILRIVEAEDFTGNLDARVGEPGFNLSSGQQQRIRIARGLLSGAELLLMDEPFNGIDETTKERILQKLRTFLRGKTVFLVTHNQKELSLVDTVYPMENGRLQEARSG